MDRLLQASEVAELLHVPTSWIREHTRSGAIPHIQLGRYIRYRRESVLQWLEEQEAGGAAWRKHRPRAQAFAHPPPIPPSPERRRSTGGRR